MENRDSIFVSVLTTRERWIHPSIVDFLMHSVTHTEGHKIYYQCVPEIFPHDAARNWAVHQFLKGDAEWCLHFDQDIDPPYWLLEGFDFATPETDILAFKYQWAGAEQPVRPAWRVLKDGKGAAPLLELWAAGTGALAVRRRVYEKLQSPWFQFEYGDDGQVRVGEDFHFCRSARAAGFRIFGLDDPKFECGHFVMANLRSCPGAFVARRAWEWAEDAEPCSYLRMVHKAEPQT